MPDLLSAFNGAIPVGALRTRQLHNRVNKLVVEKKKVNPVVVGGESIVVEKIEDSPAIPREKEKVAPRGQEKVFPWRGNQEKELKHKEKLDNTTPEMVKKNTIQEEVNESKEQKKEKRKYTKRNTRK